MSGPGKLLLSNFRLAAYSHWEVNIIIILVFQFDAVSNLLRTGSLKCLIIKQGSKLTF